MPGQLGQPTPQRLRDCRLLDFAEPDVHGAVSCEHATRLRQSPHGAEDVVKRRREQHTIEAAVAEREVLAEALDEAERALALTSDGVDPDEFPVGADGVARLALRPTTYVEDVATQTGELGERTCVGSLANRQAVLGQLRRGHEKVVLELLPERPTFLDVRVGRRVRGEVERTVSVGEAPVAIRASDAGGSGLGHVRAAHRAYKAHHRSHRSVSLTR